MGNFAVGLHKILSLLESEDVDVRVHAVKVVANLAAEGKVTKQQFSTVSIASQCASFSSLPGIFDSFSYLFTGERRLCH